MNNDKAQCYSRLKTIKYNIHTTRWNDIIALRNHMHKMALYGNSNMHSQQLLFVWLISLGKINRKLFFVVLFRFAYVIIFFKTLKIVNKIHIYYCLNFWEIDASQSLIYIYVCLCVCVFIKHMYNKIIFNT